ncbi:MAG: L-histidine N(alpha)-methyltransferase [Pleurocapsa sp.]
MGSDIPNRLQIEYLLNSQQVARDENREVILGLQKTPKTLPPRYFYDRLGSQLFEQICQLPEYYPTRTESQILERYAADIARITQGMELVELGSGSSTKTRLLLDAYLDLNNFLYYLPIDVSDSILKDSAYNLLADYPYLKIQGKVATYTQALQQLQNNAFGKRTIIFLGSSIGNLNPQQCDRFIHKISLALNSQDYFLLGIDLQKSPEILEAAYNDSQGITAKFNLNMLQHLNWRFDADFNLDLFRHQAIYNRVENQIEMYLISQPAQTVRLKNLDLVVNFAEGETVLTEISRKFDLAEMSDYLQTQGLQLIKQYTDDQQWFGLLLCQKN